MGIMWNYKKDTLNVRQSNKYPDTKRSILGHISSILDRLGLLVPFSLEPKLTIEQLWKDKIKWREKIYETLNERWVKWKQIWEQQGLIQIPLWNCFHDNTN